MCLTFDILLFVYGGENINEGNAARPIYRNLNNFAKNVNLLNLTEERLSPRGSGISRHVQLRAGLPKKGFQVRLHPGALPAQFHQAVGFKKRLVVSTQESFEAFSTSCLT